MRAAPWRKILNRVTLIVQRVTVFTQIVRAFHTTITADSWIIEISGTLAAAPVSHLEVLRSVTFSGRRNLDS